MSKAGQSALAGIALLLPLLGPTSAAGAQPDTRMSAFTTCIDARGNSHLCTQHSKPLAEGFTAREEGGPATLGPPGSISISSEQACGPLSDPVSWRVELTATDLAFGDRVYFEDLIIDAYDGADALIPQQPIRLGILAQDGMMLIEPDLEYVEIASFGYATFIIQSFCDDNGAAGDQVQFFVHPE